MAEVNEDVMQMVRKALEEDPDVENRELYERATKVDSSVEDLTLRQFHARYPLQVKRQRAQKRGGKKKKKKKEKEKKQQSGGGRSRRATSSSAGPDREAIRGTLLQFAKDVSAAEGKAEMIDLLTGVDQYVDRVVDALEG